MTNPSFRHRGACVPGGAACLCGTPGASALLSLPWELGNRARLFPASWTPELPNAASENQKLFFFLLFLKIFGWQQKGPSTPGKEGFGVSERRKSGLSVRESLKPDSDGFSEPTNGRCTGSSAIGGDDGPPSRPELAGDKGSSRGRPGAE